MIAQIEIQRVGHEGKGVGRDTDGNTYFVEGLIPGDIASVEFESSKKYRDARVVHLITSSPDRVEVPCPYFLECGGCDWLHWKYESQVSAKQQILLHHLDRAGLIFENVRPPIAADVIYAYRSRIQIRRMGEQVGFYKRRTHEIVDVDRCLVADDRINAELKELRSEKATQNLQKIALVLGKGDSVERVIDEAHASLGFHQVHRTQNERLKEVAREQVQKFGAQRVLELYCGSGNLTFSFAREVQQVVGVDSNPYAIALAEELAKTTERVRFLMARVDRELPKKLDADFRDRYDTLILDPPRSGVGEAIRCLLHPGLNHVLYVSCAPSTFTTDAKTLKNFGLRPVSVQLIDMFPHTRHIELVAHFSR